MNQLTERLSNILKMNLAKDYTSISYGISYQGNIIAADAIGTNGGKEGKASSIEDTYNVASVSKVYCTLAVMKLVEQGKVELDRPVADYLPKLYMPDDRYLKITLRHCLNHSSGLPGTLWKHFAAVDVTAGGYYDLVYDYLSRNYLKADPGAYSVYCNDGFTLAEMVVAEVSKLSFAAFCRAYITEPIGASSTQFSSELTGNRTLTKEKKKPYELLYIQGGGGYTTTMTDLCKLGNMLLHPEGYFKKTSIEEMAKPQGVSFLPMDTRSTAFGLGWDKVNFSDPDYDLGEGVLLKGGNSFQFTTQFLVVPIYDAVLAISETHDCKLDVNQEILKLFAVAMLEQGISIYTPPYQLVPVEKKEQWEGTYLTPSQILNVHMYGTQANITGDSVRGVSSGIYKNLKYNGSKFEGTEKQFFYFVQQGKDTFLMNEAKGVQIPTAQKVIDYPPLSPAFQRRIGKSYVCISTSPEDLVIHELMSGFKLYLLPGYQGILVASFMGDEEGDVYGCFEACLRELNDQEATGFITTPANGSRDLVTLQFETRDHMEYCHTASYTYQDVDTLSDYQEEGFHQDKRYNKVYRITQKLLTLPEIPNGRRILILNKELKVVYDSIYPDHYQPVEEGYIAFI